MLMTGRYSSRRCVLMNSPKTAIHSHDNGDVAGNNWSFVTFFRRLIRFLEQYSTYGQWYSSPLIRWANRIPSDSMVNLATTWVIRLKWVMIDVKDPIIQKVCCDDLDFLVTRVKRNSIMVDLKYRHPPPRACGEYRRKTRLGVRTEDLFNSDKFKV